MCCVGAVGGDDHVQQRPGEFLALQEILALRENYTVIRDTQSARGLRKYQNIQREGW